MRNLRNIIAAFLFFAPTVVSAASSVNPTVPTTNATLSSAPIRNNFQATYNDITALQSNAGVLPVGKSVVSANSVLESVLPIQTITAASKTFATADIQLETRRSNAGSAMTDTFPASTAAGAVNGARITLNNVDASATDTVTAGAGTSISACTSIPAGRSVTFVYDLGATTWRPTFNTCTAVLGPASSISGNISQFADTTGKLLNDSGIAATAVATLTGSQILTNKTLTSPIVSGGTIDNAAIGGTTAAAGKFTTLQVTGSLTTAITGGGTQCLQVSNTGVISGVGTGCITSAVATRQVLTSGSSATYTTPANVRQLRIRECGGGGSGGQNSNTGGDGNSGGVTSFNSISAGGGAGGDHLENGGSGGTGGTGGSSPNTLRFSGNVGANGGPGVASGGNGAPSFFGGAVANQANAPANSCAGGGGQASSSGNSGGGGGSGEYVEILINSPSPSYTYTIAGGGTSGGTGSGAGGSGIVVVDEYY